MREIQVDKDIYKLVSLYFEEGEGKWFPLIVVVDAIMILLEEEGGE